MASCLPNDGFLKTLSEKDKLEHYQICAIDYNNDEAQLYLANLYEKGTASTKQDLYKALLYYHLASDNGNAMAQVDFANLLLEMDKTPKNREIVVSYVEQMKIAMKNDTTSLFVGGILHPYILYMLASEPESGKWYYPTTTKTNVNAKAYLANYKIDDEKKNALLQQGSQWKQRKMLETAKMVLSPTDYQIFERTVFPSSGMVDTFARNRQITLLQQKVSNYLHP